MSWSRVQASYFVLLEVFRCLQVGLGHADELGQEIRPIAVDAQRGVGGAHTHHAE